MPHSFRAKAHLSWQRNFLATARVRERTPIECDIRLARVYEFRILSVRNRLMGILATNIGIFGGV
jgi:hypothetical protein